MYGRASYPHLISKVKDVIQTEFQTAKQEALVEINVENAMKIRIGGLRADWFKEEDSLEDALANIQAAMPDVD